MKKIHENAKENAKDEEAIKRMLDIHEEESICDQQVKRVLEPVIAMINEGHFDKTHRPFRPYARFLALATMVAAACVIVAVSLTKSGNEGEEFLDIPNVCPPLSEAATPYRSLSGRLSLEGEDASGFVLVLADAASLVTVRTAVTDRDGEFFFTDIPDGVFKLAAVLPADVFVAGSSDGDGWIEVFGSYELAFDGNSENALEIGDIMLETATDS